MKRELLLGLGLLLIASFAKAQWEKPTDKFTYGFTEGKVKTLKGTDEVQEYFSKGSSGVLGSPSSGMAKLFIPANSAGGFAIDPAANSLTLMGSAGGSTKFSVYNTKINSPIVSTTFTANFSNPDAQKATYFFSAGTNGSLYNGKSAIYTGANSGGALFNALKFSYSSNGITLGNRTLGDARGTDVPLIGGILKFNTAYKLELYMNNSNDLTEYKRAGTEYKVAPKSYHLWVTNMVDLKSTQYTYEGSANLVRPTETNATNGEDATIPVNAPLNAFLFQSINSKENTSSMIINGNIEIVSSKK
jgi:hypothetical protein